MEFVTVESRDHVGVVTVDRPPVNAVNEQVYLEIAEAFDSIDKAKDIRVAIFRAEGIRAFIAGKDLKESPPANEADYNKRLETVRASFWALYDCRVPIIGAINGPALGAGLAYAAVCDMLVASEKASFSLPEINVGTMGGAKHLSRLVPQMVVRYMHYTGATLTADELRSYGAIIKVVPEETLMDAVWELAEEITRKSPVAIEFAKRSLNSIEYVDLKEGYKFEQSLSKELAGYEDSREAVRAFKERRVPVYRDRGTS